MPSINRQISFGALALIFVVGLCGAGVVLQSSSAGAQGVELWNDSCRKLLKQYVGKPRSKAFAASNSKSGGGTGQACGMSWSAGSKKQAEHDAIKICKTQRRGNCWIIRSE